MKERVLVFVSLICALAGGGFMIRCFIFYPGPPHGASLPRGEEPLALLAGLLIIVGLISFMIYFPKAQWGKTAVKWGETAFAVNGGPLSCEKCGCEDRQLTEYMVYYGTQSGESTLVSKKLNVQTIATPYRIQGSVYVAICERCLRKARIWRFLLGLGVLVLMCLIGCIMLFIDANETAWRWFLIGSVFVIPVVPGGIFLICVSIFAKDRYLGDEIAKDLRRDSLEAQGWGAVFTRKEHGELR